MRRHNLRADRAEMRQHWTEEIFVLADVAFLLKLIHSCSYHKESVPSVGRREFEKKVRYPMNPPNRSQWLTGRVELDNLFWSNKTHQLIESKQ